MRFFIILFFAGALAGCSITQQPTAVNQLQIKVSQLENKLEERDQEINDLKYEISELSSQLDSMESVKAPSFPEEMDHPQVSTSSGSAEDSQNILRVPVSPKDLQLALQKAGYYDGVVDGKIGKKTKSAIQSFQKDHSLTSDGIVGKKTWSELKTYLSQ